MAPELKKRLMTAGVLISTLLAIILYAKISCSGHWVLIFAAMAVNLGCAYEFARLCTKVSHSITKPVIYFLLASLPAIYTVFILRTTPLCVSETQSLRFLSANLMQFSILILLFALTYCVYLGRESIEKSIQVMGELLSGLVLISFGSAALISIAIHESSHYLILWLIIVVAVNDSAAYFIGSNFESMKIAPAISPKKSLYGTLAGFAFGLFVAVVFSFLLRLAGYDFEMPKLTLLSILCIAAGQTGDLNKSVLKRLYGAKDSGSIFPGHGGILDRSDGVLAAAIVFSFFIST